MQKEIPILSQMPDAKLLSDDLIKQCRNELDAIFLCMHCADIKRTDEQWGIALGLHKGHFSAIKNGNKHFPTNKRIVLMQLAGNLAPIQYEAMRLDHRLFKETPSEKIKRLEKEIAALKAA